MDQSPISRHIGYKLAEAAWLLLGFMACLDAHARPRSRSRPRWHKPSEHQSH